MALRDEVRADLANHRLPGPTQIAALCDENERLEKSLDATERRWKHFRDITHPDAVEAAYREGYEDNDYPFTTVDAAWLASTARQQIGQD